MEFIFVIISEVSCELSLLSSFIMVGGDFYFQLYEEFCRTVLGQDCPVSAANLKKIIEFSLLCQDWFGSFFEGQVGVWIFVFFLLLLCWLSIFRYFRAHSLMCSNLSEDQDFSLQLISTISELVAHLLMSWLLGWTYSLALLFLTLLACNRFVLLSFLLLCVKILLALQYKLILAQDAFLADMAELECRTRIANECMNLVQSCHHSSNRTLGDVLWSLFE